MKSKNLDIQISLEIICVDELGKILSQDIVLLDAILIQIRNTQIYFCVLLIIFTMNHTQIKPFDACTFLTSPDAILCFRIFFIGKSVLVYGDVVFN